MPPKAFQGDSDKMKELSPPKKRAKALNQIRIKFSLTNADIAREIDVSRQCLSQYFRAIHKRPSHRVVMGVTRVLCAEAERWGYELVDELDEPKLVKITPQTAASPQRPDSELQRHQD